jgi:D-alanyl-lipoteichoic acid acyltransferase DltB (MBOAT superfamily)
MVFNSLTFAAFFLAVLAVLPWLRLRAANLFLLGSSLVFYAAWDWRFLGLLAFSTLFNFYSGARIHTAEGKARRRWLSFNVVVNLLVLGFFKYYGFFAENLNGLLAFLGWQTSVPTLQIVLPLAISFYTFHCLSYSIDIFRRQLEPAERLTDFALYLLLFPHLVAGPIVRAAHLLPQIAAPRKPTPADWHEGLFLITWGLFKKIVVADNLAPKADRLFALQTAASGEVFLGVLAFAFQIYADFSGYTDIARGTARLMGFHFDLNFRFPYLAANPQDFWRRWHISLSEWLRDYLYIPLGGSRQGEARTQFNLLATMVIGGLWHGAAWNFVLWGAYHGTLLCLHRIWLKHVKPKPRQKGSAWIEWAGHLAAVLIMFCFTLYGWLLFRAVSLEQIIAFTGGFLNPAGWVNVATLKGLAQQAIYFMPMMLVEGWMLRRQVTELVFPSAWANGLLHALLIVIIVILGSQGSETFIYFNF